jgi:hypothetical protein
MGTVVKRIEEIPEDIYTQIPSLIYKSWNPQFTETAIYHDKLINKKMYIPKNGEKNFEQKAGTKFYLTKAYNDPLDLEYLLTFRFNIARFKSVLHDFFKEHDIDFDFDLFYDKSQMLSDICNEINAITGVNLTMEYDRMYIIFIDRALVKTKSDVIEL